MTPTAERARCYTLLADDSCRFSKDETAYKAFKAHIVYNLIISGGIVFSDNQIVTSVNLRRLAKDDGVIRQLFKERMLQLSVRNEGGGADGTFSLRQVHDAFVQEGKIRAGSHMHDYTSELEFLDRVAVKQSWAYEDVRNNYTDTSQKMLLDTFGGTLNDREFGLFAKLIQDERERDNGLGRQFLQYRLPEGMRRAGIDVSPAVIETIRQCTDAPYVSNLPRVMGLDPIYAPEHRQSFELLRGSGQVMYRDAGDARRVPAKLTEKMFVEGLCALDIDKVIALIASFERKHFIDQQASYNAGEATFAALENAFIALNIRI